MKTIVLDNKSFVRHISRRRIRKAIGRVARAIAGDYKDAPQPPVLLVVLNGAFMFASELMQRIEGGCQVQFVRVSSYQGDHSTGQVRQLIGIGDGVQGRDIVVIEDIIDSGRTIAVLHDLLREHSPRSVKTAALFFKPDAYRGAIPVDYYGMETGNEFIVGFGLDYNGLGRNLKDIYRAL